MKTVKRFISWVKRGSNYWLVILPLSISIVSPFYLRKYGWGLDAYRIIGIVIEIIGLLTVVFSLSRESRKYNHTGYMRSFYNYVMEFKYVFVGRSVTVQASCLECADAFSGAASILTASNLNTIDEKLDYLLKRVTELQTSIDSCRSFAEQVQRNLHTQLSEIKANLTEQIGSIHNELKEKATLDYYLLISGAWLTVIGMIMTNAPDNLFKKFIF